MALVCFVAVTFSFWIIIKMKENWEMEKSSIESLLMQWCIHAVSGGDAAQWPGNGMS